MGAYQKIKNGMVGAYKKIGDKFVDAFLELVEQPKAPAAGERLTTRSAYSVAPVFEYNRRRCIR